MRTLCRMIAWWGVASAAGLSVAFAQGRGGTVWTTSHNDAQRTSWVRADPKISVASLSKPGFHFLWKRTLESQPRGLYALTQPVFSTSGYITYLGFKGLAYVGGAADNVYSVDYDLNKPFWNVHLSTAASARAPAACAGALTSITRATNLAPPGAGVAGRGGGGRGGTPAVYTVSTGGMLHILNPQTGTDLTSPLKMLPGANPNVVGSLLVDNMLYVATADNCGGVANGVYAMDLTPAPAAPAGRGSPPVAPDMKPASAAVKTWTTNGGGVAGSAGVALGTDGTVYVATGDGDQSATAFSDAVVALDGKTLNQKDYFTPGKTPFTSSPVVFRYKDRDVIAAANKDGRVYVLNATELGGADHHTPLAKSPLYMSSPGAFSAGAISTFEDASGTRWLLVASAGPIHADSKAAASNGAVTNGAIVAFKLIDQGSAPTLQPAWVSRDMTSPVTPTVMGGVVFALSSGENLQVPAEQRAGRSAAAVLYALDAATGRELWNSGAAIGSFVHAIGPAANDSQVYVVGRDGTLYTFGFDVER